ncbi:MAG TPA: cell envelope integrity protein TolA [Steroidobacteraceae bacterium]|jgi:colicin import membrane protein|nr:cell envelope integrity protein TolA [Steroidobacteraceae bacterium]
MPSESVRDRWMSIGMSVLLHGSLVALLAVGWWHFRHPAPAPSLPIDANVVDARTLKGMGTASIPAPKPKPAPETQPPPPPEGPPPPTPDEVAMREQAAKQEAEHEAKAQQQLLARQQARQEREEAARKAQAAADQAAAEQAEADKIAQAKKLAQAKKKAQAQKLAEEKKLAAAKKLAEQKRLAQEREAEAERQARVQDLQQSLKEEERASAASGALASWQAQITARIQHAWIRPPTAQQGLDCVLNVTQVPGGAVTGVSIGDCNGDEAVRESIEAAVYRASPLPPPPDPSLFERQLVIEFKPTN